MKFKIVTADDSAGLASQVEDLLNKGWKRDGPFQTKDWESKHGHPSYWTSGTTYMQPMILEKDNE